MIDSHEKLLASANKQTNVLAYEHTWLIAFADVDLNRAYQMHSIPPFNDASGETDKFLNNMDVIWVSNVFAARRHTFGASKYLRYTLHVEPFLKRAIKNGWTVEEVENFGKIYKRPAN